MKRLGVAAKHMFFARAQDYDVHRPCSKRFEYQTAVAPPAAFAFGSNSCEIDVWGNTDPC